MIARHFLFLPLIGLAGLCAGILTQSATGSHLKPDWPRHLGRIHDTTYSENWCVNDSKANGRAWSVLRDLTSATLVTNSPNWNDLGSSSSPYKIHFNHPYNEKCQAMSGSERANINNFYWVWGGTDYDSAELRTLEFPCYQDYPDDDPENPDNETACIKGGTFYNNPDAGHQDYKWERIHITNAQYSAADTRRSSVNHETGHSLGLADGTCNSSSVMHGPCTPIIQYPSSLDRSSAAVEAADGTSAGSEPPGGGD